MASEFVCSVEKENKLGFYRLHTRWLTDKLCINIASKDGAWFGEISNERLFELGRGLQKPPEEYFKECKEHLTSLDGKPDIVYAVDDGSFTWKQIIDEDTGMKIKLGSIPLKPANFTETIQEMMNVSLNTNKTLQQQISVLTQENSKKDSNINELFAKLKTHQQNKNAIENDLYEKFVAVLNTKKNKISQLEEELIKANVSGPAQRKKPRVKKEKPVEKMVVDPYDEDTEDDVPGPSTRAITSRQNRVLSNQQLPVTKKKRKTLPKDIVEETNDSDATITDDELIKSAVTMASSPPVSAQTSSTASTSAVIPVFATTSTTCASTSSVANVSASNYDAAGMMFDESHTENSVNNSLNLADVQNVSSISQQVPIPSNISKRISPLRSNSQIIISKQSKDILDFFFGEEDNPDEPALAVNTKAADIMNEFF